MKIKNNQLREVLAKVDRKEELSWEETTILVKNGILPPVDLPSSGSHIIDPYS